MNDKDHLVGKQTSLICGIVSDVSPMLTPINQVKEEISTGAR